MCNYFFIPSLVLQILALCAVVSLVLSYNYCDHNPKLSNEIGVSMVPLTMPLYRYYVICIGYFALYLISQIATFNTVLDFCSTHISAMLVMLTYPVIVRFLVGVMHYSKYNAELYP